jgi:hypothetical protein
LSRDLKGLNLTNPGKIYYLDCTNVLTLLSVRATFQ